MGADREYDVVVYGATGFVGKLTAAYLARSAPAGTRIALAGRSRDKLERTRADLGPATATWPIEVADSADVPAVTALARKATLVITTVGPYAAYGMPLLEACATAGTHYADLTGEVQFVRRAIDLHDGTARRTGARIVNACGFDAIPSDLGVLTLHNAVRADGAGDLEQADLVVTGFRGGFSGGTLASLKGVVDELKADKATRALFFDPYSLSPERSKEPDLGKETDPRGITRDPASGRWLAPFIMSGYNTRIVRRSNALQDWAYGRRFRYQEYMGFTGAAGLGKAVGMTAGVGAAAGALALGPTRKLLDRVLPQPGEGPSEKLQREGFFTIEITATTSTGARYVCDVAAKGDPGYAATAVMLGEAGLALALDGDALPPTAGVLTPAAGIGTPLIERLRGQGFTFEARRA
jgi:short subunit dehydrogenase-like uncharacterized protein